MAGDAKHVTITIEAPDGVEVLSPNASPVPPVVIEAPASIKLYTVEELAKEWSYSVHTIRQWVQQGVIPHRKLGGKRGETRFAHEDIVAWLRSVKPAIAGEDNP